MTSALDASRLAPRRPGVRHAGGGAPARRAMRRWAWRLFRREWRQQILILALIVVAVAATIVGSAIATDTPASVQGTFGTAQDLATFTGPDADLSSQIAALHRRFGAVDVISNQTLRVPGTSTAYQLRSQDPHGPFGGPMLSLVSGHYPTAAGEVALTAGLAGDFGVGVGGVWHEVAGSPGLRVVGIVQDPQSLLSEFALVAPGQVRTPSSVTVLFDAHGTAPTVTGATVNSARQFSATATFNPTTFSIAIATVGMLLIALVGIGGFTVLAQRRLRGIGMAESLGATDANVRLVVRMNGLIVGLVGAAAGFVLGLVVWLAYRPTVQADAHHLIGVWALSWVVVVPAMALAVLSTFIAASWPARAVTRVPVVSALAGRPAPPREVNRSAVPGVILLVTAGAFFAVASGGRAPAALLPAFVAVVSAVVLLAPFFLMALGRVGGSAPVAVRLALRDLARYRARSASALAAISVGVLIAVVTVVLAEGRYGNPLDYAGANLASNQVLVHITSKTVNGRVRFGPGRGAATTTAATPVTPESTAKLATTERSIASALGATSNVPLRTAGASLVHEGPGRNFNGTLYVATPAFLRSLGIHRAQVEAGADVLTMRPGLASEPDMILANGRKAGPPPLTGSAPCPASACVRDPVIQVVGALPSGTSAPNTVITEHAVRVLGLTTSPAGWLIDTAQPPSASQIANARALAAGTELYIETKSSAPSSSEIITTATVLGALLALGILAMSIGLIRSETSGDLRTLAATGAGGLVRRMITGTTGGALALLGAVLGTIAGYVACISWFAATKYTGFTALGHVPLRNLLLLVVGMPVVAAAIGWALGGREPAGMARMPME